MLTPLREYAEHWFAHTDLRLHPPRLLNQTTQWIQELTHARPGFDAELRTVALASLRSSDRVLVHRALAALAVLGRPDDLVMIEPLLQSADPYIAGAAGSAKFEIAHRAA